MAPRAGLFFAIFLLCKGARPLSISAPAIVINDGPQSVTWTRTATDPQSFILQLRLLASDGSESIFSDSGIVLTGDDLTGTQPFISMVPPFNGEVGDGVPNGNYLIEILNADGSAAIGESNHFQVIANTSSEASSVLASTSTTASSSTTTSSIISAGSSTSSVVGSRITSSGSDSSSSLRTSTTVSASVLSTGATSTTSVSGNSPTTDSSSTQTSAVVVRTASKVNVAAIAGGVIATVIVLLALAFAAFILYRRRRRRQEQESEDVMRQMYPSPYNLPPMEDATSGPVSVQRSRQGLPPQPPPSSKTGLLDSSVDHIPSTSPSIAQSSSQSSSRSLIQHSSEAPPSEAAQLRVEMQNLRREVEEMRLQRDMEFQPPPQYLD